MGQVNGRNNKVMRNQRRDEELSIHGLVLRIENFILLTYMIGSKIDSVKLILSCEQSRVRFQKFILKKQNSYDLEFWLDSTMMHSLIGDQFNERVTKLYNDYIRRGQPKSINLSTVLRDSITNLLTAVDTSLINDRKDSIVKAFSLAEAEVLLAVSATYWLRFLNSRSYINWYVV
jgi:hypothetical protein